MTHTDDGRRPVTREGPRDDRDERPPRKPYAAPRLTDYGSIAELTQTGASTGSDWLGLFGGW